MGILSLKFGLPKQPELFDFLNDIIAIIISSFYIADLCGQLWLFM